MLYAVAGFTLFPPPSSHVVHLNKLLVFTLCIKKKGHVDLNIGIDQDLLTIEKYLLRETVAFSLILE